MRFADKLFLTMTALLTGMFALFGTWMLSLDFSQLLNKEIEQGNNDSRTFHFLFEMGYQSTEELGGGLCHQQDPEQHRDQRGAGRTAYVCHAG